MSDKAAQNTIRKCLQDYPSNIKLSRYLTVKRAVVFVYGQAF